MRKLKYLLLVLILFPTSVHAAENYYIAMDEGNKTTYYKFESQLINWIYYYSVSPVSYTHLCPDFVWFQGFIVIKQKRDCQETN